MLGGRLDGVGTGKYFLHGVKWASAYVTIDHAYCSDHHRRQSLEIGVRLILHAALEM